MGRNVQVHAKNIYKGYNFSRNSIYFGTMNAERMLDTFRSSN